MQWRDTLALATVVLLVLTLLMVGVNVQAQIAFVSDRDGNLDIYVMDADGGDPQNLTNTPFGDESHPAWYSPAFAVAPAGEQFTMWGWLKQVVR